MTTVYAKGPRSRVVGIVRSIPNRARQGGTADAVLVYASIAVFDRIRKAFAVKAMGGTDETGARWTPLAVATVTKRLRKLRPTLEHLRPSSALSPAQREAWWGRYRSALAKYHDKGIAAKVAWHQTKRYGGVGHYDKYGASSILILRDTDALYESFTVGATHNVFRVRPGEADLGTDRVGAAAHHSGAKNLPQRRLWPHPRTWTSVWWQDVLSGARDGLVELLVEELK